MTKVTNMSGMITTGSEQRVLHISARFKFHGLHVASVNRDAFDAVADMPVFSDHQRRSGMPAATWRTVLQAAGPPRDRRRRVRLGAGLVGRLVKAFHDHGITVRGIHQHEHVCDWWSGFEYVPACAAALRRAYGRPSSLLRLPQLAARTRIVAELCQLEQTAHVLVVVKNDKEAESLANTLDQITDRLATWKPYQWRGDPWLLIKSLSSISGCAPMMGQFIVLFDAELALSKTLLQFLGSAQHSPRIAFATRDVHQLHEVERAALEGLFGPVVYRPGDDGSFGEVFVAWLEPVDGPGTTFGSNSDRKRQQIWANGPRNRLIAGAARALRDGDSVAIAALGLNVAARRLAGHERSDSPTVSVVAENLEHARQLSRLLPGWRVEEAGYSPSQRVLHDRVIVTLLRAQKSPLLTSVTVYAAAGPGWLDHANFACNVLDSDPCLLIDVADRADERFRTDTESRSAEYRRHGYRGLSGDGAVVHVPNSKPRRGPREPARRGPQRGGTTT
jgi:hypothetical protein